MCSPLGEVAAGVLLLGAGTWGRDHLRVAACVSRWQVGTARVAGVSELGLPLTRVRLACFYCHEDPPPTRTDFACSSLATCVAFWAMPWDRAVMDGLRDWQALSSPALPALHGLCLRCWRGIPTL